MEGDLESGTVSSPSAESGAVQLAAVVAFCIGLPVISALVTGSMALPHNDDWAFFRILFHLADTGELRLLGWNEMMFFGQLAWALPLAWLAGENLAFITFANALISGLGLVLTYRLASRFVSPRSALVATLAIGIFPGFIALVTTFMTEPAAYAAQLGCLLLGLTALASDGRKRSLYLAAALLVGLYGFSIREFAIAAPVAVLIGLFVTELRAKRPPAVSVMSLVTVLVTAFVMYRWRQSLGGGNTHFFGLQLGRLLLVQTAQNLFTVAFGLLPAVIFVIARRRWAIGVVGTAVAAVVLGFGMFALTSSAGEPTCCLGGSGSVFRGNLLTERGPLGNQVLPGDRPPMPLTIWVMISGAAMIVAATLLGRAVETSRGPVERVRAIGPEIATLVSFGVLTAGAIVFRAVLGGPTFDRYLTPVVLVGVILVLRMAPVTEADRPSPPVALGIGALALLSVALVATGHSYDAARWRAAEQAVASGIAPHDVDGGFEWVGLHYEGITSEQVAARSVPHGPGYLYMFPAAGNCGVVMSSASSDPRFEQIGTVPYRTWFGLGSEQVWIYRFQEACGIGQVP